MAVGIVMLRVGRIDGVATFVLMPSLAANLKRRHSKYIVKLAGGAAAQHDRATGPDAGVPVAPNEPAGD
jgi:hypothetical protein